MYLSRPICVLLLAAAGAAGASTEAAADEDEGKEEDAEAAAFEPARRRRATRCAGGEQLATTADLQLDASGGGSSGEGDALYVLRSHQSGEEHAVLLRVELLVPPRLIPFLEWLRKAPRAFSARKAMRILDGSWDALPVLAVLEHNGYLVRRPPRVR